MRIFGERKTSSIDSVGTFFFIHFAECTREKLGQSKIGLIAQKLLFGSSLNDTCVIVTKLIQMKL